MSDTTSRALALLNLLQTHRHWTGAELAGRLQVTERTVRRDIDRLRELGYRIESAPGTAGGYRLEAGAALPPLLLTDDEAVALAIGLRLVASQRLVSGSEDTITALAKLEQVLPAPLRRRVNALSAAVRPAGAGGGAGDRRDRGPAVSGDVLGDLALACRDHERIRFTYQSASGEVTRRRVEPQALVPTGRTWYLLAWDRDRDDWRTFRIDRLRDVEHTTVLFPARQMSAEEVRERVASARSGRWAATPTDAVLAMPLERMRAYFGPWARGATAEDDDHTRWPVAGWDVRETMAALAWIPEGVEYVTDLAEPGRTQLREIITRMLRALAADPPVGRGAAAR